MLVSLRQPDAPLSVAAAAVINREEPESLQAVITEALTKPEWSVGERAVLRPLVLSDVTPRYLAWFVDDIVTRYLDSRDITHQEAIDYIEHGITSNEYFMCAVCDRTTGVHVGNIKIGPIRWRHRTSDMVTVIGDRAVWGKGIASEAILMAMRIAFGVLHMRRLHAAIHADNVGSLRAYTRAGWKIEGRFKEHFVLDGKADDTHLICAFNPNPNP
jgi:RimJ/RimL family protein N-acetyltransferase